MGEEFAITRGDFTVDMSAVRDRKRKMVSGLNELYLDNYKKTGAEFILGAGRFIGPRTLEATLPDGTRRRLRGANVIISTGTRAALEHIGCTLSLATCASARFSRSIGDSTVKFGHASYHKCE
jgi:pyruvate/2-oxoglutarate dehydrogenase complex dihydrolipoamide dehydrogenase (E3) component